MMGAEPTPALEQGHSRPSGTEGGCEVRSSRRLCSVLLGGAVESALWKCRLQGDLSRRHHIAQALALSRDPFGRGGGSGAGELVWGVGFVEDFPSGSWYMLLGIPAPQPWPHSRSFPYLTPGHPTEPTEWLLLPSESPSQVPIPIPAWGEMD